MTFEPKLEFLTIVGGGYGLKVSDTDARGIFFSLRCSFNSTMGEKSAVYEPRDIICIPKASKYLAVISYCQQGEASKPL